MRNEFGKSNVCRDINSIPLGVRVTEYILAEVNKCDVFLAVIGKNWQTERLREENDFVRLEIESALLQDIPIIPVFVGGASPPKPDELPRSLQPLLDYHGIAIDSGRDFSAHVGQLIESIKTLQKARLEKQPEGIVS